MNYYQLNRQDILEYTKEYQIRNRQRIREYKKQYYDENKNRLLSYYHDYYKHKISSEKLRCEDCDVEILKASLSKHMETIRHKKNAEKKT